MASMIVMKFSNALKETWDMVIGADMVHEWQPDCNKVANFGIRLG